MIHRPENLGIGITAGLVCMPFNTDECVNVDPPMHRLSGNNWVDVAYLGW
jgi:hypothetical protein